MTAPALLLCAVVVLLSPRSSEAKEKVTFTPKGPDQHQPKPDACDIQVFETPAPDVAYVEVGTINYHDERHRSRAGSLTLDAVMPRIKKEACKVGADGLVDIRVTEMKRLEFAMFNVRVTAVRFARE